MWTKIIDDKSGLSTSTVAASVTTLVASVGLFFIGLHRIQSHQDYGWFDCVVSVLTFALPFYRLAKFEILAHRKK
jgi:hypothetical protein